MKRFITIILAVVTLLSVSPEMPAQIRVACVGNSITYGTGTDAPASMSWPAQMQRMLGPDYHIANFGRPGATLLRHGHNPYVLSPEFRRALDYRPDVVVMHLGVNDTDPRDWPEYGDEFVSDYVALIDSFRAVNPDARILVARLSPLTSKHRRFRSGTRVWRQKVTGAVEAVAEATGAELIDFDEPLRDHRGLIGDAVHPDVRGYRLLARAVAGALTGRFGGLSMPEIWQSGMVLQRYKPLKVRGRADAGARVAVEVAGVRTEAVADNLGHWTAALPPLAEATGLTMTVSDDRGGRLVFTDVSVGEVWLASGQSNMAFELCNSTTSGTDTLRAADPQLRLFDMKPCVITDWNEWSEADKAAVDTLNHYLPSCWRQSSASSARDFSAVAWHFGRMLRDSLDVPVGIICNAVGGSGTEAWVDVDMLEERMPEVLVDWRSNDYLQPWVQKRAGENTGADGTHRHPYEPSYLFASGIRPLGAYPIAGVIWYQGESNAHNIEVHEQLFTALVDSWRRNWDDERLPFIFTQLSSLSRPSWPSFRDSQRRLLDSTGATGMAVCSDIGESLDVHPRNKRPVGQRLGRWALSRVYGHAGVVPSGPLPVGAVCTGPGTVELTMKYADGLSTSDGASVRTFELARTDGLYYPAEASVIGGGKIQLKCNEDWAPRYVRYGWQPFTRANLINSDSLPASTFRLEVQPLRSAEEGMVSGVSGASAGRVGGGIVRAGGCNFPVNPLAPDSEKRFYRGICRMDGSLAGYLPEATAYAATAPLSDGFVMAGGVTPRGSTAQVCLVSEYTDGMIVPERLPDLPVPVDNAAACAVGRRVYVAGGNHDGVPSNALYVLDLDRLTDGWKRLRDFPGAPRTQPVMAASGGRLYVFGGFAAASQGRDASLCTDGLVYEVRRGKWSRVAGPAGADGREVSLGGGVAVTLADGRIAVAGGVGRDIFLEALRSQSPDYLTHPAEWYGFNRSVFVYSPAENTWRHMAARADAARAGASAVADGDGFIMLGGEIRPRIRTASAIRINIE